MTSRSDRLAPGSQPAIAPGKQATAWFSLPALLAVFIWAGSYVAAKIAFLELQPLTISGLRLLLVAPCLFATVAIGEQSRTIDVRRDWRWFLVAAVALAGELIVWSVGLDLTTAGNSVLLFGSSPVITALLAMVILGERPSRRRLSGILLSFVGVAIIVGGYRASDERLIGDLLMLVAVLFWALSTVSAAPLVRRYPLVTENAYTFAFAAIIVLPFTLGTIAGEPWLQLSVRTWLALGYSVFCATFAAYLLWHRGVRHLGSSQTMVYYYLQPILGLMLAAVILSEQVSLNQIVGAGVVFAGITFDPKIKLGFGDACGYDCPDHLGLLAFRA